MSKITIITVHKNDFDNDLNTEAKSLTEGYTNTEEVIEFMAHSRDYDIIEYSEDSEIYNPVEEPAKDVTITRTYQDDGIYTIQFKDEVGNIIESTMETTKLDKEAPNIIINAQEEQNKIKVDLSKSTDNKSGIKKFYYKINDNEYTESTSNIHKFDGLSDGKYTITVKLEDNAGNITDEVSEDVTVAYEHVYISSTGNDTTGNGSIELPYATLQRAYNKVKSGGEMILLSNLTVTSTTNMNIANKNVTLRSTNTSNPYSIIKSNSLTAAILSISNYATLTTANIIFDGNNINSSKPLLYIISSTVNLNANTIVQNSVTTNAQGGGIYMYNSTLNINGSIIKNNKVHATWAQGGGIYNANGTINMYSGSIINNTTIASNTTGYAEGGAIYLWQSEFNLQNGMISGNTAQKGGAICIVGTPDGSATMTIKNGSIIQNSATIEGGGILVTRTASNNTPASTLYIKGGTISNNTAPTGSQTHTVNGAQIIYN